MIADPALVVLVGAAGSGKSTWAARHYRATEIVSSDALRAVVGTGPADLDASVDAFEVLEAIVRTRLRRGLTTVVDTLGTDPARRGRWVHQARAAGLPAYAVVLDTPAALCRERNTRRDRPVPARVLARQLAGLRSIHTELALEGWDEVVTVTATDPQSAPETPSTPIQRTTPDPATAAQDPPADPDRLRFVLQLSRFTLGDDPAGWLRAMALAAEEAGFHGLALMDHLIQIPQVGRAWDPIPEPFVTLGLLAGLDTGLHLGTLVTPVTFRHPGVVAKTAATLDVLTGGRAFLGVGAGWWAREHAAYALDLPPARERLDRLERGIETMRALWAPGTKAYDGELVALPETTLYPRPVHDIPVIVGGNGERRTLRIAARLGDGCNLPSHEDVLQQKAAVLHEHCRALGRDPAEVAVTVLDLPVLGRDREDVATRVERLRGRTSAAVYAARHHAGDAGLQVARYRRLRELGVSTAFVAPVDLAGPDDLAPWAEVIAAVG